MIHKISVAKGDSLDALARKNGTTWQDLYEQNKEQIKDPTRIFPGQILTWEDSAEEKLTEIVKPASLPPQNPWRRRWQDYAVMRENRTLVTSYVAMASRRLSDLRVDFENSDPANTAQLHRLRLLAENLQNEVYASFISETPEGAVLCARLLILVGDIGLALWHQEFAAHPDRARVTAAAVVRNYTDAVISARKLQGAAGETLRDDCRQKALQVALDLGVLCYPLPLLAKSADYYDQVSDPLQEALQSTNFKVGVYKKSPGRVLAQIWELHSGKDKKRALQALFLALTKLVAYQYSDFDELDQREMAEFFEQHQADWDDAGKAAAYFYREARKSRVVLK